ncbi:MAG: hypothetical protein R3F54_06460 [Alphaproteobacteria bacterium]
MLRTIECALAGENRAGAVLRLDPAGQRRQHRIMTQIVVVADILVAERDADDPPAARAGSRRSASIRTWANAANRSRS